ncbi:RHS repeat-associated core domain-containing protein [Pseudoalteromonas phenolica]|uniref:RHS repeat-associated core domain-containing protein n=1 Tax=Pseudoalteromonas phenolica TaxID=161398 RepID=UPI001F4F6EAD|nr:RHS repeat-associated core domain-containing protein [Pseudoalteromonas phenolica]
MWKKSYHLIYDQYYLNSVELCKSSICGSENKLASTSFSWNKEELSFGLSEEHPYANDEIEATDMVLASGSFYDTSSDYTGDGLNDIKMLEQVKEIAGNQSTFNISNFPDYYQVNNGAVNVHKISGYIDYNLNGIADFVYLDSNLKLSIVELNPKTGGYEDVFSTDIPASCDMLPPDDEYHPMSEPCHSFAHDINKDGFSDFVIQDRESNSIKIYLRNTNASGEPTQGFKLIGSVSLLIYKFGLSDINGDGTADIYYQDNGNWVELSIDGDELISERHDLDINYYHYLSRRNKNTIWLDVNGDNLLDVMTLKEVGTAKKPFWFIHFNLGGGQFSSGSNTGLPEFNVWADARVNTREEAILNNFVQVFDYDNDGRMDILAPYKREYAYDCWDATNRQVCLIRDEDTREFNYFHKYDVWSWRILKPDVSGLAFEEEVLHVDGENLLGGLGTTSIADLNGDGWQEIVTALGFRQHSSNVQCGNQLPYSRGRFYCYPNLAPDAGIYAYSLKGGASRTLRRVDNDFGLVAEYEYKQLGRDANLTSGIYSVNNEPLNDVSLRKLGSAQKVVSGFIQPDGLGGVVNKQYHYIDGVYQTQGRGFMGFKSIVEEDVEKALITQTDFHQDFPYQGKIQRQATFKSENYTSGGNPLGDNVSGAINLTTYTWAENPSHGLSGIYHVYPSQIVKNVYDLENGGLLTTNTTRNNDIDEFGNITDSTVIIDDEGLTRYETNTVRAYDNDANIWFINRLTSSKVTKTSSGDTKTISTVLSNYHESRQPETIVLKEGSVDEIDTELKTTTRVLNDYGLPTSITESADTYKINGAKQRSSRTTSISYTKNGTSVSADGYFPLEVINAKGHTVTTHTNPATGQPTKVRKQIGASAYLDTVYGYDDFNRIYSVQTDGQPIRYTAVQTPDDNAPANAVMQIVTKSTGTPTTKEYKDKLGRTLRTAVEGFANNSWIYNDVHYNNKGQVTFESVPFTDINSPTTLGVSYSEFDVLGRPEYKVTSQSCANLVDGTMTAKYTYKGFTTEIDVEETCNSLTLPKMFRTYNSQKQLMSTVDAIGGTTTYSYNSLGLPKVIQDANGDSIVASYDSFGRKTSVNDPNQGFTQFTYNGFGELQAEERKQTSTSTSAHTIVRYAVDALGRVTKRQATGETDLTYNYDTASNGYGQLGSESGNGVTRTYAFDSFGRPTTTTIAGSSKSYTISTLYDANFGRVKGLRYPNNLTVKYEYNARGYLTHIKNAASGYVYQNITEVDKFGNIAASTLGNGLTESNLFYAASGQMANKIVNKTSQGQILNINYSAYDGFGNLKGLSVSTGPIGDQHTFTESFEYDHLHRLTSNQIVGITTISYTYDSVGNITSKSDYATLYDYDNHASGHSGGGDNAVKKVRKTDGNWVGFSYDARGNMIKGDGLTAAVYNAMDKPTSLTKNGLTNTFVYGPDHMRFKQTKSSGATIYYADKLYEEEVRNGKTTWRAYIGDIALISKSDNGSAKIRYTHRDRLGSARLFTDRNGNVEAQRNYDPFGKPREASGDLKLDSKLGDLDTAKTYRGFTDHEHLDDMELIHMNGRVYDYNLGRFMSVDPVIQSPTNSQSINPYSYIMNNPLSGTDPTGYAAEIEKEKIKVSVTGSRIKRTVGEKTTVTTTNDAGQVTNRSTQTVIGSNVAVTSTNFENGAVTSSTSAVMNGKTMTAVSSSATDIGSPATLSQSTSITTAEGSANWCYGGACRTGIMPNIDTRTIAQMDEGLENLNSTMSAVAGGFSVASMLKSLLTGLPKYVTKGHYIPDYTLAKQKENGQDIPLPLTEAEGRAHTVLGMRVGSDGNIYRQSAQFPSNTWPKVNGKDVPMSEVHWSNHGRGDHLSPHQHQFKFDGTGWIREGGNGLPFRAE